MRGLLDFGTGNISGVRKIVVDPAYGAHNLSRSLSLDPRSWLADSDDGDTAHLIKQAQEGGMPDSLGHRRKFGVIAPFTNTSVQPEFDAMALSGITNHMYSGWC